MKCAHCCSDCSEVGEDMTAEVFERCMKICEDYNLITYLGGGEPTLHPLFDNFLVRMASSVALGKTELCGCTTNGTDENRTAMMFALSKIDYGFSFNVSTDNYHRKKLSKQLLHLLREERSFKKGNISPHQVLARGRGKNIKGAKNGCVCGEEYVAVNGDIKPCGCAVEAPVIGNIMKVRPAFVSKIRDLRLAIEDESEEACFAYFTKKDVFKLLKTLEKSEEETVELFREIRNQRNKKEQK